MGPATAASVALGASGGASVAGSAESAALSPAGALSAPRVTSALASDGPGGSGALVSSPTQPR